MNVQLTINNIGSGIVIIFNWFWHGIHVANCSHIFCLFDLVVSWIKLVTCFILKSSKYNNGFIIELCTFAEYYPFQSISFSLNCSPLLFTTLPSFDWVLLKSTKDINSGRAITCWTVTESSFIEVWQRIPVFLLNIIHFTFSFRIMSSSEDNLVLSKPTSWVTFSLVQSVRQYLNLRNIRFAHSQSSLLSLIPSNDVKVLVG